MSSTVKADFAEVATVDLRAAPGVVATGAPVVVDGETLVALVGGVLSYRPDKCSALVIASGEIVVAIRPLYQDGSAMSGADYEAQQGAGGFRPLLLRAADVAGFLLVHEEPTHPTPDERCLCQYGASVGMGSAWTYVQWENAGGVRRWRVADWGAYFPATPANWAAPAPTNPWDALDRLTAQVVALGGEPIPL